MIDVLYVVWALIVVGAAVDLVCMLLWVPVGRY